MAFLLDGRKRELCTVKILNGSLFRFRFRVTTLTGNREWIMPGARIQLSSFNRI